MPSPNNITDLVIFAGGAIIVVALIMFGTRFTPFGRKIASGLRSNPLDLEAEHLKRAAIPPSARAREKYVDPLAKLRADYAVVGVLVFMLFVFIFYFMTKSTWQSGN
ncbi:MAG: hypothetical protein J0I20_14605 [Chloroflexi bacterium]|nr:hypothetical protein [Chloroflexota bacterium]OJW02731.1 MAG: hypothetical protein BGO39_05760 [Chloroflexi bacterium 54-19]